MAALITFNAADIHLEGIEVDVELPRRWFLGALGDTDVSPRANEERSGRITGRLSRSGNDIVVRVRVKAQVDIPCVRCLDPAPVEVDADMSLLLQPKVESKRGRRHDARLAGKVAEYEYEFAPAEAELDHYDGETVVLDSFVREVILLEVPNFPLCRESCPGIAAASSPGELEVQEPDPRLAPLNAFRKNDGPATLADLVNAANERATAFGRKPVLRSNHARKKKKKR